MHPVTKNLKELAGNISLEQACGEIVAGLQQRKPLIIPGFKARLTYWLNRLIPTWIFNKATDNIITKTLSKMKSAS